MTRLLRGTKDETDGKDDGESPESLADPGPDGAEADPQAGVAAAASDGDEGAPSDGVAADPSEGDEAEGSEGDEADRSEGDEPGAAATDGDGAAPSDRTARRPAALWRRSVLAAGLAALVLGGSWFFHAAHQLRTTPSARNHALTDTAATDRVSGDVADGLARVFSYTPADTDAAERSSRTVLAGRAARQYAELLAQVRANLVEQRITLSTQTVRTGVIELEGDSARLLVFLDQTSRRDKAAATSAAAQLTVTAKYRGDRWQIVDIKAR
ncbi:hypothetical protein ACFV2S_09835 [Streptomyces sp. NPDC059695]|uniref:hypothetical protein n=1 Tax=Streptomyces sp. NPDC059695 TaxID=3346910 RepID=UPI0036A23847